MNDICTHCGERIEPGAIVVTMWPEEKTRTPQQACYYTAVAIVDGQEYRGRSRHGASYERRVMVAAGVPDAPLHIHQIKDPERLDRPGGIRGHLRIASFHGGAQWTIRENEREGPKRIRWYPPPDLGTVFSEFREREKQGEEEKEAAE